MGQRIFGLAICTVCLLDGSNVLRFHGIREHGLRRDAGGLWGLSPFIPLDLGFMMLSEDSKVN